MFGFCSSIDVLPTREIEECLMAMMSSLDDGREAWLITPYATMQKLSSLKRGIAEAAKRQAHISFVVRDEPELVTNARKDLKESLEHGVKLYAFTRLHAKVYWAEEFGCLVTSANLLDSSFEASTEIGLFMESGSVFNSVREWITKTIEPGLRPVENGSPATRWVRRQAPSSTPVPQLPDKKTNQPKSSGHCLRCGTTIDLNPGKPYCLEHFKSWANFNNLDFPEKFCHACGQPHKSCMAKPLCRDCYRSGPVRM